MKEDYYRTGKRRSWPVALTLEQRPFSIFFFTERTVLVEPWALARDCSRTARYSGSAVMNLSLFSEMKITRKERISFPLSEDRLKRT